MERFIRGVNMKYTSFDTVLEEMTDMELMIEIDMTRKGCDNVPETWVTNYLNECLIEAEERGI